MITDHPALWVCGPRGVGKSTIAWAIYTQVVRSGDRAAYIDLAQLGFCLPAPVDDPGNHRIRATNLGALWSAHRAAGARCLVVSGGVERPDTLGGYLAALPDTTVTICRLRASGDLLRRRILARGRGEGPALPGDDLVGQPGHVLERIVADATREGERLDRAEVGDLCVDTDDHPVEDIVQRIRVCSGGWPHLGP